MPTIREQRAAELDAGLAAHLEAGRHAWFVTLTLPHDYHDKLVDSFDTVAAGWRHLIQGQAWLDLKEAIGIIGFVRAIETTHGVNGWHPHAHVLLITDRQCTTEDRVQLRTYLERRWVDYCTSRGWRAPSRRRGVVIEPVKRASQLARYLTKIGDSGWGVGLEMSRADIKRPRAGRTPWRILSEFLETGDADDADLWREHEVGTHRRRALTWSRGLRAALRLAAEEATDQELATVDLTDTSAPRVTIPNTFYDRCQRERTWTAFLDGIEDACAAGGQRAMNEFLAGLLNASDSHQCGRLAAASHHRSGP